MTAAAQQTPALSPQHASARALAGAGWRVFPCGDAGAPKAKDPNCALAPRWSRDATSDLAIVDYWWGLRPAANVGAPVPDAHLVVDIDPRNGPGASEGAPAETLATALQAQIAALPGPLPDTLTTLSGGLGLHYWLSVPAGWRALGKLRDVPGIDLKQKGGYLIMPGSWHPSGRAYQWASLAPVAAAPQWLLDLGHYRDEYSDELRFELELDEHHRRVSDDDIASLAAAIAPHFHHGVRHTVATALSGWLAGRGWQFVDVLALVAQLPSLDHRGLAGAVRWVFERDARAGWMALCETFGDDFMTDLEQWAAYPDRDLFLQVFSK